MSAGLSLKRFVNATLKPFSIAFRSPIGNYCPICKQTSERFNACGDPPRANAECPHCESRERHRLDWLFFHQRTNLFTNENVRLLHIAPEEFLQERLRSRENIDYLSADLMSPRAMVKMDLTDIQYADNSFDAIYCSHVLEHIPDDRKALSELYRVLAPGGWALLQVPITAKVTYEDPSITSPEDRKKHFGQWDHVRRCGPDYVERMREAGFNAETLCATDIVSPEECARMGFGCNRLLFFCRK